MNENSRNKLLFYTFEDIFKMPGHKVTRDKQGGVPILQIFIALFTYNDTYSKWTLVMFFFFKCLWNSNFKQKYKYPLVTILPTKLNISPRPRIKSIPSYASDRHIYVCILGHLMACQCLELASGSNICQQIQNLVRVKSSSIKQTTDLLKNSATHPLTIHKSTKWKGQKCNIVVIATSVLIK